LQQTGWLDGLACSVSCGGLLLSSLGVAQIESQKTSISAPPPNVSVVQLRILVVGSDIAANVLFNGGLASLPAACSCGDRFLSSSGVAQIESLELGYQGMNITTTSWPLIATMLLTPHRWCSRMWAGDCNYHIIVLIEFGTYPFGSVKQLLQHFLVVVVAKTMQYSNMNK